MQRLAIDAIIAAAFYAVVLWAGHYFPWPGDILTKYRVLRYAYGLGWFLVSLSLVLILHGLTQYAGIAWAIAIAGGMTNVICYAYDGRARDRRRLTTAETALDAKRADEF